MTSPAADRNGTGDPIEGSSAETLDEGARVRLPHRRLGPVRAILVRVLAALALLLLIVTLVWFGRSGYRDVDENGVDLLDAFYYATVSLSTTGYGDITPYSRGARLVNVVLITPARVLFLIILVGTTLEVLTERSREDFVRTRWRARVHDHVIVCGYGTKGRAAIAALLAEGLERSSVLVVERSGSAARAATADGLAVIEGSSTASAVLSEARADRARAIVVATDRDDAAVLTVLTARQLTRPGTRIVAAVREVENAPLLRQSGADQVVISAATSGRLLGMATVSGVVVDVVEDLLTSAEGLALTARAPAEDEVGRPLSSCSQPVVAFVRDGTLHRFDSPAAARIADGDILVAVRHRPSTDPRAER